MALSRWSPTRDFDRLFSDFFGTPLVEYRDPQRSWALPLDIVDRGDAFEIKAPVPGFKPEEVEVTVHNGMLNITAEHRQESETNEGNYLRREVSYGNYGRSVQLPGGIKDQEIKASFDNGMLMIEIPKVPAPQPTKIPVSSKSEKQPVGVGTDKK